MNNSAPEPDNSVLNIQYLGIQEAYSCCTSQSYSCTTDDAFEKAGTATQIKKVFFGTTVEPDPGLIWCISSGGPALTLLVLLPHLSSMSVIEVVIIFTLIRKLPRKHCKARYISQMGSKPSRCTNSSPSSTQDLVNVGFKDASSLVYIISAVGSTYQATLSTTQENLDRFLGPQELVLPRPYSPLSPNRMFSSHESRSYLFPFPCE